MPNHFANRRSPSGPKTSQQFPYYNTAPAVAAPPGLAVPLVSGAPVALPAPAEQYEIPSPGKLDTLQIRNCPIGTGADAATYQVRKNGANVGSPVVIANDVVGPMKVDLSNINVQAGDLIDLTVSLPALGGAPTARILFTWTPSTSA